MASVLVSVEAGVQTLILNRPEKLNAFTPDMHKELRRALEQALDDRAIGAVLLTGAGRGFCSGQDLSERNVAPTTLAWGLLLVSTSGELLARSEPASIAATAVRHAAVKIME